MHIYIDIKRVVPISGVAVRPSSPEILLDNAITLVEHGIVFLLSKQDVGFEQILEIGIQSGSQSTQATHPLARPCIDYISWEILNPG